MQGQPMEAISSATVVNASAADPGTVAGAASLLVSKKALNMQASSAAQLIQALPQPVLAASGSLGTQVNTYA
jgi:hypothetical protein